MVFPWRDLRLRQPWVAGPESGHAGPHLLSVNECRPHRLRDVVPISRATLHLVRELREMPGFYGIATAFRPRGGITYSLSIWTSEDALRAFTVGPPHRRVMEEYRSKGYLRHVHWWGEFSTVGIGMAEATRRLDAGEGRRVGEPRDRWAREDQDRLARLAARGRSTARGDTRKTG